MKWVKVPAWIKWFVPQLVWELPSSDKIVYLTFDDGPTPFVTERVLVLLHEYNAKATFFCLGRNVELSPELFEKIKSEGHAVGNHGYNHLSGFRTSTFQYLENANKGFRLVKSTLFRPPYGKITPIQVHYLKSYAHIIMWSIMSMDFDAQTSPEECLNNVIKNIYPGAIIVCHDTEKAVESLLYVLPRLLEQLNIQGYKLLPLSETEVFRYKKRKI